jgi:hypothetical protein
MKLCAQCEFIYEDDQELCDMDGSELVYEPTLPVAPAGITNLDRGHQVNQPWARRFSLASMIGLALALVLFVSYNAFTSRRYLPVVDTSSIKSGVVAPIVATAATPATTATFDRVNDVFEKSDSTTALISPIPTRSETNQPTSVSPLTSSTRKATNKLAAPLKTSSSLSVLALPRVKALPRLKPLPRLEDQTAARRKSSINTSKNPSALNQKKDSRFGSFLKKTARVITRPFKR